MSASTLIVGCGYVGQEVARRLLERGERVVATTRSPERAEAFRRQGIEPIVADVLDPGPLRGLAQVDRLLFSVGYDRRSGVPLPTVYVEGLRSVLDALRGRVGTVVYTSSTGVYGQADGGWVDEDSPTEPREASGRACLEAERVAREFGRAEGIRAAIVRFSGLYGPHRIIRREALLAGEPIGGDPEQWLNLIHRDDAAAAAIALLDRGPAGAVYLASDDRPISRRAYYEGTARCLDAPAPRFEADKATPNAAATGANKRIRNRRIQDDLGLVLAHPSVETGIPASLDEERRSAGD